MNFNIDSTTEKINNSEKFKSKTLIFNFSEIHKKNSKIKIIKNKNQRDINNNNNNDKNFTFSNFSKKNKTNSFIQKNKHIKINNEDIIEENIPKKNEIRYNNYFKSNQRKKKRITFNIKFVDIIEIESYKKYNKVFSFSDFEFIKSKKNNKCFCEKYCEIF